jgi:23S rRNA (uracil1939-C5)-methyltransferase
MGELMKLKIARLGAQGDGLAVTDGGPVFVPFALAGETVDAEVDGERGRLNSVVTPSALRVEPICPHFGRCGGCALQHLDLAHYRDWKRQIVVEAFAARGIESGIEPLAGVGLGARRRAALSARRDGRSVTVGFYEAGSHALVDLRVCPVLAPEIVALLPGLRELAGLLLNDRAEVRIHVLLAETGLDVDVAGSAKILSAGGRAGLAERAAELGLIRLSLDGDTLYQSGAPIIRSGAVEIVPPPATFLQAAKEAEALMAQLAVAAFKKRARQAADLFCGVGAFSFALAAKAKVLAIDSDEAALAALEEARRHAQGVRAIATRRRDLFLEPLSRKELEVFDLVLFDPPRAGAKAQAEMLARSRVPTIVAISCNPATLARDLRILIDGGYRLERATPIDQFLFTHHVEVVAVLRR